MQLQNLKVEDTENQNYPLIKGIYKGSCAYFFSQAKEPINNMLCYSSTRGTD